MNHLLASAWRKACAPAFGLLCTLTAAAQGVPTSRDAAPSTRAAQQALLRELPFADRTDFDDTRFGFVAAWPDALVPGAGPRPVWSM